MGMAAFLCVFTGSLSASDLTRESFKKHSFEKNTIDQIFLQEKADAFYLRAERAAFQNKRTKALELLKEALFYQGNSPHFRNKLAELYIQGGLYSQAFLQYQRVLKKNPENKEARFHLAQLLREKGLYKEALAAYTLLLAQNPEDFSFGFEKALTYRDAGLYPQALSQIKRVFSLKKLDKQEKIRLYLLQALVYKHLKKPLFQKKALARAIALNPVEESPVRSILAHYMGLGDIEGARDYLLKFQKKNEPSVYVARVLSEIFLVLNEKESLYRQLRKIQNLDTLDSFEAFQLASLLVERKQYSKALPFFSDLLRGGKFVSESHYFLGFVYEERQKKKKARKHYWKVHSSNRYFFAARIRLAYLLKKEGQWELGLEVMKNLNLRFKKKPFSFLVHAEFLKEGNKLEEALQVLNRAETLFPNHLEILFLKGFYLEEVGKTSLAVEIMKRVLERDPNHVKALNFLAYSYAQHKGPLDRAEKMARKALSLSPKSGYILDTLGWILYKRGYSKKALVYVKKAFERNQEESVIAEHLGEIYRTLKEYRKSAFYFQKAAALEKDKIKSESLKKQSDLVQARL